MNLLNIKTVETKPVNFSKTKYEKLIYHINRKDNKTINSALFRDIYNAFEKKHGTHNLMVRAVNSEGMKTFKSFDMDELNFEDFHEYYENKVKFTDKFEYFISVEITILKKIN